MEREKSIETSFFPAREKTKTWRRNRDNRRKPFPTRSLFQAERDGWVNSWIAQEWWGCSVRLFHIKGTFCPALGFAWWSEGVARHSAWGHIGLPIGGRKWRREDLCEGFFLKRSEERQRIWVFILEEDDF